MPPDQTEQLAMPAVEKAPVLEMRNFSNGIDTSAASGLIGPNALRFAINCYIDSVHGKVGSLTTRYGIKNLGSIDDDIAAVDSDDEICGLGTHESFVVAMVDTNGGSAYVYYLDGGGGFSDGTWKDTGTTPLAWIGAQTSFCEFVNYLFAADGNQFKSIRANTFFTTDWGTTNLSGAPSSIILLEEFQGRLYAAGGYQNQYLYFSKLPDSSNNITWDTTIDYIIFNATEDPITALEKNGSLLLIFKEKEMYTWDGQSTQSDPLYNIGAVNQQTVQTIDGNTFFLSQGVKYLTVQVYSGGIPQDISKPVREFLKLTNLINVRDGSTSTNGVASEFGSWKDDKNYYLSICDVTIDGVIYPNIILSYSLENQSWTIFSIAKKTGTYNNFFKYSVQFRNLRQNSSYIFDDVNSQYGTFMTVIGGKPLGTTATENTSIAPVYWNFYSNAGNIPENIDDVGESSDNPIDVLIQTHELEYGSRSRLKIINKFNVFASGNYGFVEVSMRVDGGDWIPLGSLTGKTTTFEPGEQGYYFEFRLKGSNTGEPFVFEGFDFFDVTLESYET